jgi:hypothetical protein
MCFYAPVPYWIYVSNKCNVVKVKLNTFEAKCS